MKNIIKHINFNKKISEGIIIFLNPKRPTLYRLENKSTLCGKNISRKLSKIHGNPRD